MSWKPISATVPQYHVSGSPASGYYLKAYQAGTTTAVNLATDSSGGTTLARVQLNSEGYPINGSSAVFIPYIGIGKYKLALYLNATDADNNTTGSAAWVVDNISIDLPNTTSYELGSVAATQSHNGISTGHIITTNYHDTNRTIGSGGEFRYTGTTDANDAGNWPHTDGYFYDADGKQFQAVVFDVRMFGAGNGDSTTAIQACLTGVPEHSRIVFGNATYSVSDDLDITTDHLVLDGWGCKITQTAQFKKTLHLEEVFDCEIMGFELVGVGTETIDTSTSFNGTAGIYIGNSINVRVHHNYLNNHAGGGIRWATPGAGTVCQDINIHHNVVRGMGSGVISSLDNTFDAAIGNVDSANYVDIVVRDNDCSDHCFGVFASANLTGSFQISGNYIHDIPGQHGIYCNPTNNASISGNTIRSTEGNGIKVQIRDNALFDGQTIENCSIENNTVINADVHGIDVVGDESNNRTFGKTCVVKDNTVLEMEDAGARGIQLTHFQGVCRGNVVKDIKGYGIRGDSVSGEISYNVIEDVDYNGIEADIKNDEKLHIVGNEMIDCTLNSGSLAGTESRVRYYAYITGGGTTPSVVFKDNIFRSDDTETADYDNALRVDSPVDLSMENNSNYTDHNYLVQGTISHMSHGHLDIPYQTRTGAGALDVTMPIVHIVSTGVNALTLADGVDQQVMDIVMTVDGGAATLTPDSFANGTDVTFDDAGDSSRLLFTNSAWHFMGGTATLA